MKTALERNMESLWADIENHAEQEMTEANVTRLSVCAGAYKALCMVSHKEEVAEAVTARTVAIDGDTEFERIIMSIPADDAHMKAVTSIMADHMESLKVMNRRVYDNLIARLESVAKK